jgi:acetyl-CoA carboxylase carboxyltransferase component
MPVLIIGSLKGFNGDPRSMENRQLFGGATIAEAIVRHRGPITVVDMGYIIGGTFVVVSKQLNPHLRMLALEGSHAQVIGGKSAAKVVFRSRIRRAADRDTRVADAKRAMEQAAAADQESARTQYEAVRREVIAELEQRDGAAFDQVHSVQRAQEVGALDEVVSAARLREVIIRHQEEALRQYRLDTERAEDESISRGFDRGLEQLTPQAVRALTDSLTRVYGLEGARTIARELIEGLKNFSDPDPSGSDPQGGGNSSGGSPSVPP